MEIWKDIPGYEGRYQVSNIGRVRRLLFHNKPCPRVKQIMAGTYCKGYLTVGLYDGETTKSVGIHRAVALAFIPNPDNKPETNHKDSNKSNNHVSNLEWCTTQENILHSWKDPNRKKADHRGAGGVTRKTWFELEAERELENYRTKQSKAKAA